MLEFKCRTLLALILYLQSVLLQVYVMHSMEAPNQPHYYIYANHAQPRHFPYKELNGKKIVFALSPSGKKI